MYSYRQFFFLFLASLSKTSLLLLLESPEVILKTANLGTLYNNEEEENLYQEGGVELPHCHLVLIPRRRNQTVKNLLRRPLPDLLHDVSQFCVALIYWSVHFDFQTCSYHSKEGRPELDSSISFERHVHRHKALTSHAVGTQLSEAERRRDLPEQGDHVHVLDSTLGVRVVLAPEADKLVEVVGTQDRPVAGEVVKVVHDDGHEEVEDEEAADDEEGDEVEVGKVRPATSALGVQVIRLGITPGLRFVCAVQHYLLPALPCGRAEEN